MEGSNIEVLQFLIDNNADLVAKNEVEKIINIANVNKLLLRSFQSVEITQIFLNFTRSE